MMCTDAASAPLIVSKAPGSDGVWWTLNLTSLGKITFDIVFTKQGSH